MTAPLTTSEAPPPAPLERTNSVFPAGLLADCPRAATSAQPVTVGIPFPRGTLKDAALSLTDAEGRELLLQTRPLAHWPDGSVQWLLLDFIAEGASHWLLGPATEGGSRPKQGTLRVAEAGTALTIETGAATFRVDRATLTPLAQVTLNGCDLLQPSISGVRLTDARGQVCAPRVREAVVEDRGPVRATVRLEGVFEGTSCRFVARLCFFAGTGLIRCRLTVHNPNRARHQGGLWDLGDAGSLLLRGLSVDLGLQGNSSPITWTAEPGQPERSTRTGGLEIYQDSSGGENWNSRNHLNRDGRVPCSFRGYRVRTEQHEEQGLRASPVVSVETPHGRVTAAVPDFWQQFPKGIEVQNGVLRVQLFPEQFADLHELQGGEQKTHTVWLHFGAAGQPSLDWVHQPACVHATPEWYDRSGALSCFLPAADDTDDRLKDYLADVVDGPKSLFARREVIDEYGWRHFGDVWANHEANPAYNPAPPPVITHYNNQFDVVHGLLLQHFRTGDRRWRELADALARHVIDIDIYHTDQDKAAYNGGLFWFTDHYKDAGTSTHRTFSRQNCQPGDRSYGGGPDSQHNFATGLLHYYYLTGDPTARETVVRLADWVLHMDDGRRVRGLGLLDEGPTGLASRTLFPHYHGPGRGPANSIQTLLDGWLLTGQRDYLSKAEELVRRCAHPDDDLVALDLLNAELRWSYPLFLVALARFLDVKAAAGELDYTYAYAQSVLVKYVTWMGEHERPYFDQRERLEFPTETWPAQEFRKANVLRLAAAHVDEPLRSHWLRRGQELAERAWHDLLSFESRHVARAVAILMVEGVRDQFFRAREVASAPPAPAMPSFGSPENFVPQKQRVLARLKTPRGLAFALWRLACPWNWRKLWFR